MEKIYWPKRKVQELSYCFDYFKNLLFYAIFLKKKPFVLRRDFFASHNHLPSENSSILSLGGNRLGASPVWLRSARSLEHCGVEDFRVICNVLEVE